MQGLAWKAVQTAIFALFTLTGLDSLRVSHGNIFRNESQLRAVLVDAMRNETYVQSMLEEMEEYQEMETTVLTEFPCDILAPSDTVPASVHELRPSDIKVVAAIGDSYTAARASGGLCPFNMLFDYRGFAWSIGGNEDYRTHTSLPNFLREYSEDLYGFSRGVGDRRRNLNIAEIGARTDSFVSQARSLVDKLRDDDNVDIDSDWKVITVFLGGNDLCGYCWFNITPEAYISNIAAGLDVLYNDIPRAFVNLVTVMNVGLTQTLRKGIISNIVLYFACACGTFPETEEDAAQLDQYSLAYQQKLTELIDTGNYESDNFTVVIQPFFQNLTLPYKEGRDEIDYSFFAIDRFHISKRGQGTAGLALWNSMFEPVGNKSVDVKWRDADIVCPTEDSPYLLTARNSDRTFGLPNRKRMTDFIKSRRYTGPT